MRAFRPLPYGGARSAGDEPHRPRRESTHEHHFTSRPVQIRRRRRRRRRRGIHAERVRAAGKRRRHGRIRQRGRRGRGRAAQLLREAGAHHRYLGDEGLRRRGRGSRRRRRARSAVRLRGGREGGAAAEGGHGHLAGQHLRFHHPGPDRPRRGRGRRVAHHGGLLPPVRSRAGAPLGVQLRRGAAVAVGYRPEGGRAGGGLHREVDGAHQADRRVRHHVLCLRLRPQALQHGQRHARHRRLRRAAGRRYLLLHPCRAARAERRRRGDGRGRRGQGRLHPVQRVQRRDHRHGRLRERRRDDGLLRSGDGEHLPQGAEQDRRRAEDDGMGRRAARRCSTTSTPAQGRWPTCPSCA